MKKTNANPLNNANAVVANLELVSDKQQIAGAKRFGINSENALGVSLPVLRALAKSIGKSHELALRLWKTNIKEARILASMIDEPAAVTEAQMDEWTAGFNSWDVCDQVCSNLFDKTPYAVDKAIAYSKATAEFTRRAGFVLMATYAVHNKKAPDAVFLQFLNTIAATGEDDRDCVKHAISWALRQIGKRNMLLHRQAVQTAKALKAKKGSATRWIGTDALHELEQEKVISRIKQKDTSGK